MKLFEILNANAHLTPDEIVTAISDPLSRWQSLSTFMTPEMHEVVRNRQILLLDETGFYCTNHQHFNPPHSYRTQEASQGTPENAEGYDPYTAQGCGGWWVIGFEHCHVARPTTAADPSHETWGEDQDYDEDPDYAP